MKRFGSIILCATTIFVIALTIYFQTTNSYHNLNRVEAAGDEGSSLDSATVSFGGWMTSPALDRFPGNNPRTANHHALMPKTVKIKAGGMVNFIIGGFHHVLVYDDGSKPGDINPNLLVAPTGPGNLSPILINDPNRRIYRGLDPSLLPQDRVEVVHFDKPGLYLVICGVRPHFVEGMYGYVRVLPNNDKHEH